MLKWLWLSVLIIVLDQISKGMASAYLNLHEPIAVLPSFNFTLMHNTGAAFSFLRDAGGWQRWFFASLAIIVSVILVFWLRSVPRSNRWLALALALVLGGALGNLWDRLVLGYVVDFIQIYYQQWYYPAFNIADSAIFIGAGMLIVDSFRNSDTE